MVKKNPADQYTAFPSYRTLQLSAREFTDEKIPGIPSFFPVTGKVSNDKNEPLAGATVTLKGTSKSVLTNEDGSFTIDAVKGNVLVISSVGYREMEVTVGDEGTPLNLTMVLNDNDLDEVVVIGYGTTKRRDLTGSIVSVKPKEITARPGPNPMESLQGRVAGLDITRTSGQPGAGINIQLRGTQIIHCQRQSIVYH